MVIGLYFYEPNRREQLGQTPYSLKVPKNVATPLSIQACVSLENECRKCFERALHIGITSE